MGEEDEKYSERDSPAELVEKTFNTAHSSRMHDMQ